MEIRLSTVMKNRTLVLGAVLVLAAAGIIVLLAVLLLMNSIAIILRQKLRKRF